VSELIIKRRILIENKAQMMVLESVVFAITVIISLIFLYQISPTSTESTVYTSDLKIKGDATLQSLYNEEIPVSPANLPVGFPKNKLVYYLITDDYNGFVLDLKKLLPPSSVYNIFISNGTEKVLWSTSALDNTAPLSLTEPIAVSHYFVAIHPQFFNITKFKDIIGNDGSKIAKDFCAYKKLPGNTDHINESYTTSTYDVILEMSKI